MVIGAAAENLPQQEFIEIAWLYCTMLLTANETFHSYVAI
jgi:hypothetical protein